MTDGRVDYRRVEASLYALGGAPEPRVARPQSNPVPRQRTGAPPVTGFREVDARIDLSIAVGRLEATHVAVLRDHYIVRSRRHPYEVRSRAVRALAVELSRLVDGDRGGTRQS